MMHSASPRLLPVLPVLRVPPCRKLKYNQRESPTLLRFFPQPVSSVYSLTRWQFMALAEYCCATFDIASASYALVPCKVFQSGRE
jgi:hypothetical protein